MKAGRYEGMRGKKRYMRKGIKTGRKKGRKGRNREWRIVSGVEAENRKKLGTRKRE